VNHAIQAEARDFFNSLLVPFVALVLMRGPFPFNSVAGAQCNFRWMRKFPFRLELKSEMEFVTVVLPKNRGAALDKSPPNLSVVCPMRARSFPYQVMSFVEEYTAGLREMVRQKIALYANKKSLTAKEAEERDRLWRLKDDLFLYMTDKFGIRSLGEYARSETVPGWLSDKLSEYGLTGTRQAKDIYLTGTYVFFKLDIISLYLAAHHKSIKTTTLYTNTIQSQEISYQRFIDIFDASLHLIKMAKFDRSTLRSLMRSKGLTSGQIDSVFDERLRTKWGNSCATPKDPPKGFEGSTIEGGWCTAEHCLDGCTSAHFLWENISRIRGCLSKLYDSYNVVDELSRAGSSLEFDIKKLEEVVNKLVSARLKNDG
jgi:hypothetical protein